MAARKYYVYVLRREDEPDWRYVGKGSGYRNRQSQLEREATSSQIVYLTDCEQDALRMERSLWKSFVHRGYVLTQAEPMMEKVRGWKHSEDSKLLMSEKAYASRKLDKEKRIASALVSQNRPSTKARKAESQRKAIEALGARFHEVATLAKREPEFREQARIKANSWWQSLTPEQRAHQKELAKLGRERKNGNS